ncbi:MAG: phosphoribosylamine--glycine ligase [Anaerolineales bacterium]|nr:phosphoribosylamine--glycine ligase [Anaerolineales bacterium]
MKVLLVGSGGREHALAWKLAQSPQLKALYIAPGNAGTAGLRAEGAVIANLPVDAMDGEGLAAAALERKIDLAVIGPEAPLAAGLADTLRAKGFAVFGPSRTAAEIESSKVFAKEFMARRHIPSAKFSVFREYEKALAYVRDLERPVVIKADGLAAGKGVILPENPAQAEAALHQIMVEKIFGGAGERVVLEEKLSGPEVSLFAFTDGVTIQSTVPAQDHKRVFDRDRGPNTGGMGAYAPVPVCAPAMAEKIARDVLQAAVDGLREEGRPFAGVLYGGLMLTSDGPKVIEFNCRFGDPEVQVILPLLESDLLEILAACAVGKLKDVAIRWSKGAAACVVLASKGYPGKYAVGCPISGLEESRPNSFVFHAGTKTQDGQTVTAGGRVLCVTGWGENIEQALKSAYTAVGPIRFDGMHYRKDIGRRAVTGILNA